ncbi:hypothetical protein [Streptomyces sp. NPDC001137]|uniref:hypothetical protein n=1 Tax=Streptomyces sp. NPDC001137 TaxID=3154378 RepID=UPI00332074B6
MADHGVQAFDGTDMNTLDLRTYGRAVPDGEHADRRDQVAAVGAEQVPEGADRVFVAVAVVEASFRRRRRRGLPW